MTRINIREIDHFIKLLKESKEALELHITQSTKANSAFSKEPKLTGITWGSTKNHFEHGYGPLLQTFDTTAQILTEQFSAYTFAFFQEVTGGYPILDTAQLHDLEIRMQQLASYKAQWLLDMADDLAGIPGLGKFFDELSLESTTKEVILLRKFQEFEFYHRNDFDEVAEALHFLKEGLEAVGNKKNFQGANKGFSTSSYANERWFEKLSKFNEDNKDKVAFIKKADATTAAAVAEQTAQIHNAQMNMNQMGDAIMNEVNSNNSYQYNPLGGKSWFKGEATEIKKNPKSTLDGILATASPGKVTRGKSTQWNKQPGSFSDALNDFNNLGILDAKEMQTSYGVGYYGKLPDGRIINVRPGSSITSTPTIEITNLDGTKIKIRYLNH